MRENTKYINMRKYSIYDNGGRSRKKHEDPLEGMYEEVDQLNTAKS